MAIIFCQFSTFPNSGSFFRVNFQDGSEKSLFKIVAKNRIKNRMDNN
jgi:hypothetical protein